MTDIPTSCPVVDLGKMEAKTLKERMILHCDVVMFIQILQLLLFCESINIVDLIDVL